MRKNSIKFRIPLYISVLAFICVLVTGLIFQVTFRYKFEDQIENKNMIISQMASNELALYLDNATETVITAASFSTQSNGDLDKVKEELFRMYDNFHYFDLIFFMNSDADMVFSKPSNASVQSRVYKDRDYYWAIIEDDKPHTLSSLLVSSVLKKSHFIIAAPVKDEVEETIGLIGAGIPLGNIKDILRGVEKEFEGRLWIVDQKGSIVIHPEIENDNRLVDVSELKISGLENFEDIHDLLKDGTNQNIRYKVDGLEYYGSATFLENYNWLVVVEQDKKTIISEIYGSMSSLMLFQIIVLILAVAVGLMIAGWLTKPIEKLVNQVRELPKDIEEGNPINSERFVYQRDEMEELSSAFVVMGNKLQENITGLEVALKRESRVQQYLNNILASVHSGIIVADAENNITMVNQQAMRIIQYYREADIPKGLFELASLLNIEFEDQVNEIMTEDVYYSDVESTLKTGKENEISISYSLSPVKDKGNNYLGVVFQFRDITKIKKIEEELRKEDRIHTMGELSASIIHDIGNPLAGISNLIEVIKDQEIDQTSKLEVLNVLTEEVNDLNVLVINFLDFVKSSDVVKKPKELRKLIKSSLKLYGKELNEKHIEIKGNFNEIEALVMVESRSIKQAIINILKNAIEAIGEQGTITFEVEEGDKTVTLEISDDGYGMSEETKEKLFYPFYSTKEEGTGLGLFTAYTALKENGCTLEVLSEEDKGSKFVITFEKE